MTGALLYWLPLATVLVSAAAGVAIFVAGEDRQRLRTTLNLSAAVAKLALVAWMALFVIAGQAPEFRVALLPGLDLVLRADGFAMLFATLSATLWLVTTVYAVAYLERGTDRARFFGFFSLCVTATMGIAMAGNLLTFFVFYELLTLTTWPLVVHKGTREAYASARSYLAHTLSASAVFLVGMVWLYALTGPQDFVTGGTVAAVAAEQPAAATGVFVLLVIGMGVKAALFPLHSWLPKAMVAPAPVSALLHAVAVVKAGAFGLIRVVQDVFGPTLVASLGLGLPLVLLAGFTIVYGSVLAVFQTDIKKRLAYSTVSQVSYIALGIAIGGPLATIGGIVHLVHQGLMKITLFFGAGIYDNLLGIKKIDDLDGVGRRLPWTSFAFTLAALGMIGLPPAAGFVSKWYLGAGAVAAGMDWVIGILIASTVLNAIYLLPVIQRIWLRPTPDAWPAEAPASRLEVVGMVGSAVLTAFFALAVGVFSGHPFSPVNWAAGIVAGYYP
ncbi:MAG: complex I subunit 5 family protein [Trueperaceae bacterium]